MANFDLLQIFITVAECGNITRAAEKLYISQPAVSSAIKKLETSMGGTLLERQNKGVVLTANGKQIYTLAKQAIEKYTEAQNFLENAKRMQCGELRIGTNSSNIALILSDSIFKFCTKYPKINIKITRKSDDKLIEDLLTNELDYIFIDREDLAQNLNVVKTYDVEYAVVGSKPVGHKLSMREFLDSEKVLINKSYSSRKNIDQYFARFGESVQAKYEVDNYQMVVQMIKMGMGIGIVNPDYFKPDLASGKLHVLPTEFALDKRRFLLVTSPVNQTDAAKKFLEFIK